MLKSKAFKIIGHRGAAGLILENTLSSINHSISLGVDCIEIDVWQTTDGELIVFHDAYLDRLSKQSGFVADMTYQSINQISLNNGDKIPKLVEVVELAKKNNVQLIVEVKSEKAFEETFHLLNKSLDTEGFIIGSFFHTPIMELKMKYSDIQTAIMFECVPVYLDEYLDKVNPDYVVISIETYNQYLLDVVKKQNRKLIFYTVNTKPEIELAIKAQPYGIVTNFPNLFLDK